MLLRPTIFKQNKYDLQDVCHHLSIALTVSTLSLQTYIHFELKTCEYAFIYHVPVNTIFKDSDKHDNDELFVCSDDGDNVQRFSQQCLSRWSMIIPRVISLILHSKNHAQSADPEILRIRSILFKTTHSSYTLLNQTLRSFVFQAYIMFYIRFIIRYIYDWLLMTFHRPSMVCERWK